jgi:hypothetical protein
MVAWSLKGVRSAKTDPLMLHRLGLSGIDRLRAAAPFATDEMLYDLIRVPLSVDPLPVRLWLECEMMADKWRLMGGDRMGVNKPSATLTQAQIEFVKDFPSWRAAF